MAKKVVEATIEEALDTAEKHVEALRHQVHSEGLAGRPGPVEELAKAQNDWYQLTLVKEGNVSGS